MGHVNPEGWNHLGMEGNYPALFIEIDQELIRPRLDDQGVRLVMSKNM